MSSVTIRIWQGNVVRQIICLSDSGSSTIGAVGGARNSTRPDIELDPWSGFIVDHRMTHPIPMDYREPSFTPRTD